MILLTIITLPCNYSHKYWTLFSQWTHYRQVYQRCEN